MDLSNQNWSRGALALLLLAGVFPPLTKAWGVVNPSISKATHSILSSRSTARGAAAAAARPWHLFNSRFDELVGMDNDMETPSPVDDRYYSVPPTQPQLLINTKPRVTLTRFLSNIVKENPEVR